MESGVPQMSSLIQTRAPGGWIWQCSLGWLGFSSQAESKADNEDSQSRSPLHNSEEHASGGLAFLTELLLQGQYRSTGILKAEGRLTLQVKCA